MARNKKNKRRGKPNSPSPTPPIKQYAMDTIQINLTKNIISNGAGAGISHNEACGIVEAILLDYGDQNNNNDDGNANAIVDIITMASILCDYMPEIITEEEAQSIVRESVDQIQDDGDSERRDSSDIDDGDTDSNICHHEEEPDDEHLSDGDYIQEGECELCERHMKLTRHHLIPKDTWGRIRPRFLNASPHYLSGDFETATEIMSIGTLPPSLSSLSLASPLSIKIFLGNYISKICRPCHSMVHRTFDNVELAEQYNTIDKLLVDVRVHNFCKWANKQKPGKQKLGHKHQRSSQI